MSSLVKKCCYCRNKLEDSIETGLPPSVYCERCRKNETKYGKPKICRYCQLPAAFLDEKCVYCAHAERKHGQPAKCANCKLTSYFDPTGRGKPGLCRMCINVAHSQNLEIMSGVKVPKYDIAPSRHRDKRKRRSSHNDSAAASVPKPPSVDNGEHVLQVQQLNDRIFDLNKKLKDKDDQLIEKEKKIAILQREIIENERRARERYDKMMKDHEKDIYAIHEKYKQEKIAAKAKN